MIHDLIESRDTSIVLGVILLGAALCAYKWRFTVSRYRLTERRNEQLVLTCWLLVAGVLMLLLGVGVLG